MNLTKDFLRSLIIEEMNKQINEATEEEIGYLDDVLEMPKDALPFHDIFGDRYRILSSFNSNSPDSPFSQFEKFLYRTGWTFNPDNMAEVEKSITTSYIANPEDGVQQRTKVEKMSISKWMQDLVDYVDSVSGTMSNWNKVMKDMLEYANNTFKKDSPRQPRGGFKLEYLKDKNYLNMFRKRLSLKKSIMKFLPEKNKMQVFSGIGRVRWESGEETAKDVEDYFKLSNLKKETLRQRDWLMGSKGSGKKNYVIFSGKNLDEYRKENGNTEYIVFSRHPIDVFRMSDHQGLDSCHTPPSSREKLGASPSEEKWDQYNICALSEAHANGMIAYALNPDDFEEPPTQALVDQYEDKELFTDDERDVEGFTPVGRIRIKNVAFLADKGDYSQILTRVAVPENRSYGDMISGFKEHVAKVLSQAQKSKIEDIVNKFEGDVDLRRFLRVGGHYQDNSMSQILPEFFGNTLDRKDIEYTETVQYSNELEQSLKDQYMGTTIENATETLQSLQAEYNGGFVNFDNLEVEEDWNGDGFYMSGEVRVIYNYADEIEYVSGKFDVRELINDAIDYAAETYFYDDAWFTNYSVLFDTFWGGYKNVMIISIPITNFNVTDNGEYFPHDPDTWMYALSEMKDKLTFVMDRHADDSLNNTVKDYISHASAMSDGEEIVRTDISERYYLTKFKKTLEEDGNWDINEEELDNDNPLGFDVLTSFTAEFSDSSDLNQLFREVNEDFDPENPELVEMAKRMSGHISTLISILASEGMNVIKAGLLNQAFLSNQSLYSSLSQATKLDELDMKVEASIGWSDEISPDRILQGIAEDDDLNLSIKITCEDWDAVTIETVGKMMLGRFNDNNGWHIDVDECLEALVRADIPSPPKPTDIQEMLRLEIINLLQR